MVNFATCIHINAPLQRVFEIFTDLRAASSRIEAIQNIEVLTEGPIGKGTRFAETRSMFGRSHTETMEITEWNPPHSYSASAESCGSRYVTTFVFQPDGDATNVEVTFSATPITFMAKLMSFMLVMMKSTCRKMFEKDMADLKAAAEGTAAPQPIAA